MVKPTEHDNRGEGSQVARGRLIGIALLFLGLFALYQPQLFFHPARFIADRSDGAQNFWLICHGLDALESLDLNGLWQGNIFYPFT